MVRAALPGDRRREEHDGREAAEVRHERVGAIWGEVFRRFQREGKVRRPFDAQRPLQVHRRELARGDGESVSVDVVPVNDQHVGDSEILQDAEPDAPPPTDVDGRAHRREFEQHRTDKAGGLAGVDVERVEERLIVSGFPGHNGIMVARCLGT